MHTYIIFGLLCFQICVLISHADEYYWKVWNGTVPYDAVAGGIYDGKPTYIGTTLFPSFKSTVVTTIYGNGVLEVDGHLGPYHLKASERTWILCAPLDDHPTWKSVRLNAMLFAGCKFIHGGYHDDVNIYIGRKKIDNNILLGQVFPYGHRYQGFETWKGKHVGGIWDFEALGFCWKTTTSNINVPAS